MKLLGLGFLFLFATGVGLFLVRLVYLDDFNFGLLFAAVFGLIFALACFFQKKKE